MFSEPNLGLIHPRVSNDASFIYEDDTFRIRAYRESSTLENQGHIFWRIPLRIIAWWRFL